MESAILSRKTLLQLRPFDVERVHFRLPDGRERDYDLVRHVNAVTILPVDEEGQVYLVRQYRVGAEAELLELPAGVIDPGEEPLQAAHRELREEIGKDCSEMISLGGFFMAAGYTTEYMHVFLALHLKDAPLAHDDDEFLTTAVMPFGDVMALVRKGGLEDGKSLSTLLLAQEELSARGLR